ncbi:MAG: pyrimidine-nucleoside phosphorylase [Armatimonadaceae bacterium]
MQTTELIARKRDGHTLTTEEIRYLVHGYTQGTIPDYQISALLMAIYLRGMDTQETAALTAAMAESGQQLDLSELANDKPTLDKHSTGGVGDKVSLVVVPLLAAAGAAVCKMSGRGLGHTGGTLDKLESLPGFRVGLSAEEMKAQVARVGACLAGQTEDLAPADKKLYALRDATATVGSLPLIVSSILSKKLAGGAASFLFDVKTGSGALMKSREDSDLLAKALVEGAAANGRCAVAVVTDMSQPLGHTVGNALEVAEAIRTLTPGAVEVHDRFRELCLLLTAEGLKLAGLASGDDARPRAAGLLDSGVALHLFRELVEAQGGDPEVVDDPAKLPAAPLVVPVNATVAGFVAAINTEELGQAVVGLGGGRATKEDTIDPAVGLVMRAEIGSRVEEGQPLAEIHARSESEAVAAAERIRAAYTLTEEPVSAPPLVYTRHYSEAED